MKSSYNRIIELFAKLKSQKMKEIGRLTSKDFTRRRKMSFEDLGLCILNKKGLTLNMELENFFDKKNDFENTISKQNFSKQRKKLNPELFKVMNKEYISSFYNESNYKTFHGYILLAIDGSIMELPNTKDLREEYGGITDKNDNVVVARTQTSGIYDCLNKVMIDSIISPYKTSELSLAKENIKEALELFKNKKILLIFDRGYPSIEFIYYLNKLGIKYLFRIKNQSYTLEKKQMKSNDEIVDLNVTYGRIQHMTDEILKEEIKRQKSIKDIRITKVTLDDGTVEELVSNLTISEVPYEKMKQLYYCRWNIELSYDVLKNKLHIENFSGYNRIAIEQDFYAQILLYNMLEDMKQDAENMKAKNDKLKYEYKINMNSLIGLFKLKIIEIAIEDDDEKREKLYTTLLLKMQRYLVPIKTNRSFSRTVKNTNNKHTTNLRRNY